MSRLSRSTRGAKPNFRKTKDGAGMTASGVKKYRSQNPGSKLKTAVTKCDVKVGTKAYKRQKLFVVDLRAWDRDWETAFLLH